MFGIINYSSLSYRPVLKITNKTLRFRDGWGLLTWIRGAGLIQNFLLSLDCRVHLTRFLFFPWMWAQNLSSRKLLFNCLAYWIIETVQIMDGSKSHHYYFLTRPYRLIFSKHNGRTRFTFPLSCNF